MYKLTDFRKSATRTLYVACSVFAFSSASIAAPTVSGTTISWPADGWYQVQNANNFQSICEGGRSCNVASGDYIVINHSTGLRYEVRVGSGSASPTGVSVEGQTISWPDDGWYQVQRADTYQSLCNGGQQCTVANGNYIVINHSKGTRTEVSVGASSETPLPFIPIPGTPIQISSDNVISWPNDGWYEVQSATSYMPVCLGGRNCAVEAGTYNVINHTTGKRFEGVEVGSAAPTPTPTPTSSPQKTVKPLKKGFAINIDGNWVFGRSSPWERDTQWNADDGNKLLIDSQVQGSPGTPNSLREQTTTFGGAQWAVNYTDTHLQIIILGPDGWAYPTASIYLDSNNSKGTRYDGVDDYHIKIPINNGNSWDNNRSIDDGGALSYGANSAILNSNAIEFATCTCAGNKPLWEISIDLAAANLPKNKPFGFDIQLSWGGRTFGWADESKAEQAMPSNMGTMILE